MASVGGAVGAVLGGAADSNNSSGPQDPSDSDDDGDDLILENELGDSESKELMPR